MDIGFNQAVDRLANSIFFCVIIGVCVISVLKVGYLIEAKLQVDILNKEYSCFSDCVNVTMSLNASDEVKHGFFLGCVHVCEKEFDIKVLG